MVGGRAVPRGGVVRGSWGLPFRSSQPDRSALERSLSIRGVPDILCVRSGVPFLAEAMNHGHEDV